MLYPIATQTRTVQSLNGVWKFKLEDDLSPNDVTKPLVTDRHLILFVLLLPMTGEMTQNLPIQRPRLF